MAVAGTNLTSGGSFTAASSFSTASVSPGSNRLLLLSVSSDINTSSAPNEPTVTGNGLTWVKITGVATNGATNVNVRTTLFRALGTSPSSGVTTIDFAGQNQSRIEWTLDEFTGTDTSGTNGSGAVVQSATAFTTFAIPATVTVTLAAFGSTDNATYGAFGNLGQAWSVGSGFTQLAAPISTGGTFALSEWKATNDTSVDATAGQALPGNGIAVEIKAAAAVGFTKLAGAGGLAGFGGIMVGPGGLAG